MLAAGALVRLPPKMMAHSRDSARTYVKSDPIGALAVARATLREPDLPTAYLAESSRELRLLVDHREDVVAERTRHINPSCGTSTTLIPPGHPRTGPLPH